MISINLHEAKTRLSKYRAKLKPGETLMFCRRNVPIAELGALPSIDSKPRPIGKAKGQYAVPDSFFEPLPEAVLREFDRAR